MASRCSIGGGRRAEFVGWGDEIIASGQARLLHGADPSRKVLMLGKDGQMRLHPIWDGNPRLLSIREHRQGAPHQVLRNYSGCRPYIDYARTTVDRWAWNGWRVSPGEIYLTPPERRAFESVAGCVVIEPHVKGPKQVNKQWGFARWQALVDLRPDLKFVQLGPAGTVLLRGVRHVQTATLREAAAALSQAQAAVLPEGGLHHAAAALGVPAVVLFGGFISPASTGYDTHVNLFTGWEACGHKAPCPHCRDAMARIDPAYVAQRLTELC